MNEREDINVGAGGEKIELPYYNSYPEAEPVFEFESAEEKKKKKKRKTAIIVWSVVLGCLLILGLIAYVVLDHFIFFPKFTEALETTVSDIMPDTKFNFEKFEDRGQSTVGFNDGTTQLSYWETHKGNESSMRITVKDADGEEVYKRIENDKSLAFMYGDTWYGASAKGAEAAFSNSSAINAKLSDADIEYILSLLKHVEKSSAKDDDARITANFVNKVFKSSSISASESFYGNYEILGISRYVKCRTYTVNNENLAELFNNLITGLNSADPTVQQAVVRTVNANLGKGMTFGDIVAELEGYVADIEKENSFSMNIEVCYSGKKLSALLITSTVNYSSGSVENSKFMIDFFANGAKIHTEEEFVSATEADGASYVNVANTQITVNATEDGSASYQFYIEDNGDVKQIKITLNNSEGKADVVAALNGVETFRMTGVYSDTKEQINVKFEGFTRNGETDQYFRLLATFYYRETAIETVPYNDITTMSEASLQVMQDNKFELDIEIPEGENLEDEIEEFFGFKEKTEDIEEK